MSTFTLFAKISEIRPQEYFVLVTALPVRPTENHGVPRRSSTISSMVAATAERNRLVAELRAELHSGGHDIDFVDVAEPASKWGRCVPFPRRLASA